MPPLGRFKPLKSALCAVPSHIYVQIIPEYMLDLVRRWLFESVYHLYIQNTQEACSWYFKTHAGFRTLSSRILYLYLIHPFKIFKKASSSKSKHLPDSVLCKPAVYTTHCRTKDRRIRGAHYCRLSWGAPGGMSLFVSHVCAHVGTCILCNRICMPCWKHLVACPCLLVIYVRMSIRTYSEIVFVCLVESTWWRVVYQSYVCVYLYSAQV
jgi:hypothetical protein